MNSVFKETLTNLIIILVFLIITLAIHFTGLAVYMSQKDWVEIQNWKLAVLPIAIALIFLVLLTFSQDKEIATKRMSALTTVFFLMILFFAEGGIIPTNYSCSWIGVYALYILRHYIGDNTIYQFAFMTFVILINGTYLYVCGKTSIALVKRLKLLSS